MELKEFITKTLTDIKSGIKEAGDNGVRVSQQSAKNVEFDISVTTNSSDESKIGGGIFVTAISLGANTKESNNNSAVSRIKFTVPLFIND